MIVVAAAMSLGAADVLGDSVRPAELPVLAVDRNSITVVIGDSICVIDTELPGRGSVASPSLHDFVRNLFVPQQASCRSRPLYTEHCYGDCLYAVDCDVTCSGANCDESCHADCTYWLLGCGNCLP